MVLNSPTLPAPRRLFHTAKKRKKGEKKEKKKSPLRGVVVTFIIAVCSLKISERLDHQQRVSQSFIHLYIKKKINKKKSQEIISSPPILRLSFTPLLK